MENLVINKEKLFGTDGIRGTPGIYPLTDGMIFKIGSGIAHYIRNTHGAIRTAQYARRNTQYARRNTKKLKVVIGRDTRLSGSHIENNLANAISLYDLDVILVGIITTPGLSFLTRNLKANMGIMISASHNKAADNGIKFFNWQGQKFSEKEEKQAEDFIFDSLIHNQDSLNHKQKGKIRTLKAAKSKYVTFLASTLQGLNLKGIRIALDCAFGAASPFAKKLFHRLGADVYSIHDTPEGDNINKGGAIDPVFIKELVLKSRAHIGIAVDGDGDRGILVDEKGRVLDGDCIIAIIARYLLKKNKLPKKTVVTTVMSNYGLKLALEENGLKIISTNVGDKYVLEALLKNNLTLGGEQSGHILFLDYLPTPDGLLTALQMLKVMRETQSTLNELSKCIIKFPQILVNVKVREKKPFEEMPSLNEKLSHFNAQLKDKGRILLRYSGTEPLARVMVEGRDKGLIENIAHSLAEEIRQEIGI